MNMVASEQTETTERKFVPAMHKEGIGKTLEWLSVAIEQIAKSGRK